MSASRGHDNYTDTLGGDGLPHIYLTSSSRWELFELEPLVDPLTREKIKTEKARRYKVYIEIIALVLGLFLGGGAINFILTYSGILTPDWVRTQVVTQIRTQTSVSTSTQLSVQTLTTTQTHTVVTDVNVTGYAKPGFPGTYPKSITFTLSILGAESLAYTVNTNQSGYFSIKLLNHQTYTVCVGYGYFDTHLGLGGCGTANESPWTLDSASSILQKNFNA